MPIHAFTMTGAVKRALSRVLIGLLLFMQLVVAAYACPLLSTERPATPATASSMQSGNPCDTEFGDRSLMDDIGGHVCAEHCRYGQQSADHPPAPALSPAVLTALYPLASPAEPAGHGLPRPAADDPAAVASPPHAILHCCFRS